MNLKDAVTGKEYVIKGIQTDDEELNAFLFSLGCYSGESIMVVSQNKRSSIISVKDSRYSIDTELAEAINI